MDREQVSLSVGWNGEQIVSAVAASRRPQAAGVLVGRPLTEAVALVPRLFSLCGRAQGVAARLAVAAAIGGGAPDDMPALTRSVAREAVGEHLWRLLLDWPPLLGRVADREGYLRWRKRLVAARTAEDDKALADDLLDWLAGYALAMPDAGAGHPATRPAPLLPWRSAAEWAAFAIDDTFARQPTVQGQPAETGALARQLAHPDVAGYIAAGDRVAARLSARYVELSWLARALADPELLSGWLGAAPAGESTGLARVETARGLLLHLIQVNDGRVARYVIVAPTEWNFHPQGAFVGELVGCSAASREAAASLAGRLALALDPCVSYEVRVEDA